MAVQVEHQSVNKFLLILTSIVGLLVAAILVGPSMINWNNYKTDLTNGVERLTGRKLTINGDIEISIFPAPAVVANDVYLSNSDRASAKNMFSLKSLEIRVALGPLLGGQVKIQTVHMIDPVIELQRFADGHTNMDFLFIEEDLEVKKPEVQIGKTSLVEASKDMQFDESASTFSLDNFSGYASLLLVTTVFPQAKAWKTLFGMTLSALIELPNIPRSRSALLILFGKDE